MRHSGAELIRTAVRVEGVVQGVGFRPFVYTLATGLGLTGHVGNDLDGVFVEVEGPAAAVGEFLTRLERDAPPLARIERVTTTAIAPRRSASFAIAASQGEAARHAGQASAGPWSRRTPRPAPTACASSPIRPTGGSATRSSTAPTAAPGSPSSGTCPTTGR